MTALEIPPGAKISADISAQLGAWMVRQALTREAAADALGVNVHTLRGWIGGRPCRDAAPILSQLVDKE